MTRLRQGGRQALLLLLTVLMPARVFAQAEGPGLRPRHLLLSGGVSWSGSYHVGDPTAQLRGNGTGATPPSVTYFTTDTRVTRTISPEFRIGVALTRTVAVDAGVNVSHPHVAFGISGDTEAPDQQLPGEELQQYVVDGGLTWQLPWHSRRLAPFVAGGGGYLRQLHQDRMLGETGQLYYAGGGVRYWLRGGSTSRSVGIRGDLRLTIRRNGLDFENATRTFPTFTLALFAGL